MSKQTLEHLSSLMDGELSQETGMFLTRRVCADMELGKTWARYHLIRDCMRSNGESGSVSRFSVQIDDLLAEEASAIPAGTRSTPAWLKPVSGLAVAATVAMTAVLLVAPESTTEGPEPAVQPFASPNTLNPTPPSQAASFNGAGNVSGRMNDYLLRHNQAAGTVGPQGFVALVPIVSTTSEDEEADSGQDTGTQPEPETSTPDSNR